MINLLPEKEKKELILEENKKIILIFIFFVLVFLISLNLILVSIKINTSSLAQVQKTQLLHKEKELQDIDISELQEKISQANLTFSKLKSFYADQIDLTEIFKKISAIIPEEIYLTSLSYKPVAPLPVIAPQLSKPKEGEEFVAEILISGYSLTQKSLFEFRKNLKEIEEFEDVYFPLSSWVKLTDIDFSLKFKVKR